jgi:hypothetical protein
MCGNRRHCGTGGNLDNTANALASTANFLKGHGWQRQANPRFVVTSLTRDECKAQVPLVSLPPCYYGSKARRRPAIRRSRPANRPGSCISAPWSRRSAPMTLRHQSTPDEESHPTHPIQEVSGSVLRADCVRAGRKRLLRGPGKSPLPTARQGMICKKHDDGADDRHDQTPDVETGYTFRA